MIDLDEFLESLTAWCEKHQVKDGDVIFVKDDETFEALRHLAETPDKQFKLPNFTFSYNPSGCEALRKS